MKRTLSFILALVLLIGLMPMQVLASGNEDNPWKGRSAVFVGDSITAGSGTTKIYYEYLEESLGFGSVTPMGVAGSCISAASDYGQSNQPLVNRYKDIPSADLIVVFMGTNDYGHETPLGSVEGTQDGTFYGALNVIIPALVAKHPSSKIVFVTPLHRYGFGTSKILGTQFTFDNVANGVGATLGDYVDALKTVCANNGVSVIDLYTECTLDPADAETRTNYLPDGLHPNAAGHEVIAGIMESHIHGFEPAEQEPVELTEMVYGNRFAAGNNQTCRASSRINYYLKAGTVITLKDSAAMQWACTKTSDETSSSNLGYFPDSGWSDKETAVVEADGWVGFVFKYRDETEAFDLSKPLSDYITIEEPHTHSYENGICTGCGSTTSPYLQQLPENISGCSNLYDILTPTKGYYTATKYDTSNGVVLSVVIPVEPGDRIAASSFGPVTENMGSVNGIRVTYLLDGTIAESLSASSVYTAYTQDGYLTVPAGVNMVSVPWWTPSDSNWLTLSQISKNFASHSPKTVSAQAPTCTENGYTAGEICEICNASLGSREEIPATGHDYSGNTCTICGTVNVLAFLDGKYVSILGDSISTFNGYSNDATVNTTIGGNGPRYDAGTADTKPGSYCLLESVDDTWWMHFANRSGMKLLVNNSWAGSQVFGGKTSDGRVIPAAYLERCINLHDNTIENNPNNALINPDVIFVYLGINDYNFNRSNVGDGTVDYAALIDSDGTYVTPTTFGEAYGILLHKMQKAYPNAQIFAMTLLPENLYSVDKTAWEQHNAYIRAAAEYYGIPLVDLAENCAITWANYSGYMIDKIHPTTAGMKLISDCIEAELVAYYKENPPHTHTYTSIIAAPTCTEQGYTTYTCICGHSYDSDYVAALGHSYAYTDNGNGTHTHACSGCGDATTSEHSYTNNACACACGHTLVDMITNSQVTLEAMLQLDFNIITSVLTGADNYAVITHTYADGTTDVATIPQSQWTNGTQASYSKIAAKEMGDQVTIVIYNAQGQQLSIPESDSIKAYAYRGLTALAGVSAESQNGKLRTLLVDMLNYGTAAQIQFGYDTDNLVNADLTDAQKAWATVEDVTVTNNQVKDAATYNTALTLESAIQIDFIFYTSNVGTSSDWANRYAIVTYTDHYGEKKEMRIEGATFSRYNSNSYVQVNAVGMAVADYQSIVTCTVYDADGNALAIAIDSVEGYAYRALASGVAGATLENLCKMLMKFSASADIYFA